MSILVQFTAGYAVGLFTNNSDVIALGDEYLSSYVWDCAIAGIHFSLVAIPCLWNVIYIIYTQLVVYSLC